MADLAQFEQVIMALMSPDNNVRGQAEAAFNQAKANPDALISALTQLLRTNQQEQVCSAPGCTRPQPPQQPERGACTNTHTHTAAYACPALPDATHAHLAFRSAPSPPCCCASA